jgi:hypothetical protein
LAAPAIGWYSSCDEVNFGSVIWIEPGSQVIGRVTEEHKVIDPFDDVLDTIETIDGTNGIGTLTEHHVRACGAKAGIVVKMYLAIEVEADVYLIFGCNWHLLISSIHIVYGRL